ncbi:MAG: hypothetical protein KIT09_23370 [Bryobacteraceae bacterium]|nr:hypothetical protein [Bryobacteraceae bacterium]
MLIVALLLSSLAAVQPEARSWTPESRSLSIAAADPRAAEMLCQGPHSDPVDAGLSWSAPQKLGEFTIDYATLGGRAYEPSAGGQSLQYWTGKEWRAVPAAIEIDYRERAAFAALQESGTSRWRYRFAPVETDRLRVLFTQPANEEAWHRCFAVRAMRAGPGSPALSGPELRVVGPVPQTPAWLEPGANLAVPETGARIAPGPAAEVQWPKRMLVSRVESDPPREELRVEWWDGVRWRGVEPIPSREPGAARFLPVSTTRIRAASGLGTIQSLRGYLDSSAGHYFREAQRARTDVLGARFRGLAEPDLGAMRGLMLPLDFAKTAIGRPADLKETMVNWNGTFLMTETTPPAPDKPVLDRWFAFAAGPDKVPFGADWAATDTRYLDGYLPATVTTSTHAGVRFEAKLWVTSPDQQAYGTAAEVLVTNESPAPVKTVLTLAMGRRPYKPKSPHPLSYSPDLTGYALDGDRRSVRSAGGDVVLYSETPGEWGGTPLEHHLSFPLALGPKETKSIRFLVPSVETSVKSPEELRGFDWAASLRQFRAYWDRKLNEGMRIELPEPELNAIYRNLLAQSLITTLDGDSVVQYGAYSYESYFGLEEGWPAVALAQSGYPAEARKILSIMLSPRHMDKKNYHHQYRNGLAPFYAVTIYRLTGDRAWLEEIAPALEAAAEWTIQTIDANTDPKYGGILPRHAYGGDIHTPAYSLYSNATCWRGLQDTALAFRILGRREQADRYQREADRYRKRLWDLADGLADRKSRPPFLPMSFEVGEGAAYMEKEPSYAMLGIDVPAANTWVYLGNYWNLFAPCFLELKLFENDDPRSAWVADYMDQRGGILAGLVRFTIGLDQIYGKGYYENLLERGQREEFLTSLYGILAHGMSENLYSFPEVAGVWPLRTEHAAAWREHRRNFWDWGFQGWLNSEGEPLSAGPGMALQMLRMALVRETLEETPQDELRLLDGAPRHWFAPGRKLAVDGARTFFGDVSLSAEAAQDKITARVTLPSEAKAADVLLRLPHPSGKPLRQVQVNRQFWGDFSGDEIRLPRRGEIEIVATY